MIHDDKFPTIDEFKTKDNLEGYKLKYNIDETFYYIDKEIITHNNCILKVYPYSIYEKDYYIKDKKPIILLDGELYLTLHGW